MQHTGEVFVEPSPSDDRASANAATPRWKRPSNWIAVGLLAASLGMVAFAVVSLVLPGTSLIPDRPTVSAFLAVCSSLVALPTVGAILAIVRPRNPIGWLFLVTGVGFAAGVFATEYVGRALYTGANLPGVVLVDWIGAWITTATISLALTWIPLLFPDGHLPGPRWRAVAWASVIVLAAGSIAQAILPDPAHGYAGRLPNPLGVGGSIGEGATLVLGASSLGLGVVALLSLVSLVVRFRRSREVERQQLKWFLFAASFLLFTAIVGVVTRLEVAWTGVQLGLGALPVAAGIAVLRYRLYEIDVIINRTIVYGLLTAILAGLYAGLVALLQRIFVAATGAESDGAIVLTTVVVVSLFSPVRGRIQQFVDRRFKDDADSLVPLNGFVTAIETRLWPIAPEIALRRLLEAAAAALGAPAASVARGETTVARIGVGSFEPDLVVTAGQGRARVTVAVGPRPKGTPYTEQDRLVLQSAVAAVADALAQQA